MKAFYLIFIYFKVGIIYDSDQYLIHLHNLNLIIYNMLQIDFNNFFLILIKNEKINIYFINLKLN